MIEIVRSKSENSHFKELIISLDEDLNSRYGLLQSQYDPYNKIHAIDTVVIAYEDGEPVGCGCFKSFDVHSVEIKRMFVRREYRGRGIAKMILSELESWAKDLGNEKCYLETGSKQFEAIAFYTNVGYTRIENFGQYIGNDNSICMCKALI